MRCEGFGIRIPNCDRNSKTRNSRHRVGYTVLEALKALLTQNLPLPAGSGQDLDFVHFLSITPSRTSSRLYRLALGACFLSSLMTGKLNGQDTTAPSTNQPTTQPTTDLLTFCSQASSVGNPNCVNLRPQTTPVGGQEEIDISSPRITDRLQNQYRGQSQDQNLIRTVPIFVPPPPPTEFQRIVSESTSRMLPIFGASMFRTVPSTFAPVDNIPVTPEYVIGPGDEIRLQIWGQVNQRGTFVVDRTGSISLPEVGTIHVAGLQFSQLSDFLKSQIRRVYRNFDLNVNLGQLRSIQVFVVGQARQPGSYTIGSLSTLLNALFASGGPLPQGSLRDIQVKRGNETITHFDLYDLLLHGDKSKDVRLASGDVIFVPAVGPQVAVVGSVTTPAIYELRGEESFREVIAQAGGLTNLAADSHVQVQRIDKRTERSMISIDPASADSPPVQDGDIISIIPITGRFKDAVTLRGNVADPGRYTWHDGMRISDLIPSRDALVTRDYYHSLTRLGQNRWDYDGPQNGTETTGSSTNYNFNQLNQPVANPDSSRSQTGNTVTGNPALGTPAGSTPLGSSAPGSPAPDGSLAFPSRPSVDTSGNRGTTGGGNSISSALTSGGYNNFPVKTDVVLNAPDIDWEYAVIERQSTTDLTTSLLPFNLAKAVIEKDPAQNLSLLPGDVVTIFSKADIRVPGAQQTKFVKLEGEFVAAGVYSVLPGETLRQLLARAGGLTPEADLFASEFSRETVRRLQRQRLLDYADQLESQISATASASASTALNERDAAASAASASTARAVVTRLREAQPTGRIVLPVKPDSQGTSSVPDIQLQDGDRFVVPRTPATVSVVGQVYNSNAFLYQHGKRVKDYLYLAGGPDRIADRKRAFILRADGSVVGHQSGSLAQHALFTNRSFEDVVLYPGDTIVVPPIIQKTAVLRNLSDVSTIIGGFGLGIAAINVLK